MTDGTGVPRVRPAQRSDLDPLVRLHRATFPDYESSRLGHSFTRRLFGAFQDEPSASVFVVDGQGSWLGGYLVGCPPGTQRQINHALMGAAGRATVALLLREPGPALRRVGPLWRRGRRAAGTGRAASPAVGPTGQGGSTESGLDGERVVLIGVDHRSRGTGAADALLSEFRRWAAEEGAAVADLVVESGNRAARACYERNGWTPGEAEPATDGIATSVRYRLEL